MTTAIIRTLAVLALCPLLGCDPHLTMISTGLGDASVTEDAGTVAQIGEDTIGGESANAPSISVVTPDANVAGKDSEIEERGQPADSSEALEEEGATSTPISLILETGYLGANGFFTTTRDTLYTCAQHSESNQQFLIQIGATLEGADDLDPDFVQFNFTSDTSEWVGTEGNTVFQSFEACNAAQQSCDEVVIGEGTSGYPDAGAGHMGIQNVMCRYWDGPAYTIEVSVEAVYLLGSTPGPELIGKSNITIDCQPVSCCPPVEYIETRGNHTTLPWDCGLKN